jgi:hypothetical protein
MSPKHSHQKKTESFILLATLGKFQVRNYHDQLLALAHAAMRLRRADPRYKQYWHSKVVFNRGERMMIASHTYTQRSLCHRHVWAYRPCFWLGVKKHYGVRDY